MISSQDPALNDFSQLVSQDLTQGLSSLLAASGAGAGAGAGAGSSMPCIQKLLPCQPYLHSPSPPALCCLPLKEIVTNDSKCLCDIFNNPEILKSFNITQDDALKVPKACGVKVDLSECKNGK
ncbi:LTP_2 domain-containing protein [Cephalotus follicularis]|uniref:LTP_2 domain-containing protein n=1 Tax=Cephalotus follicularis TaxID=3775 RepID=A0A1Q3BNT9_CEPFO|nr:LTP_2 domain-containing protein [Cephalotus follicularis]